MKKTLLFLAYLLAYTFSFAQVYPSPQFLWEKTSNIGQANAIKYWNNALYMTGGDQLSSPYPGLLLQKLDTAGVITWDKPISFVNGTLTGDDLLVLPDGKIVVGGSHYNHATNQLLDFISFYDANGDLLYFLNFNHPQSPLYTKTNRRIIRHGNSGYLFAGNILFMMDSIGAETWSKDIGVNDVLGTADGGFVVCGNKNVGPAVSGFVWKFDANGDSLWYHDLSGTGGACNAVSVLEDPINQNVLVLGNAFNANGVPDGDLFIQTYSASGSFQGNQFMVRQGDDILYHAAWGGLQEIMLTTLATDSATSGLVSLLGVNTYGDLLYDHVRGQMYLDFYRQAVTDGQNIYMAGTLQGFVPQLEYKKLDLSTVLTIRPPMVPVDLNCFPNPVQSALHITPNDDLDPDWKLWDYQGRLIKVGVFPIGAQGDWQIAVDDLRDGVYLLEYGLKERGRGAVRIVVGR